MKSNSKPPVPASPAQRRRFLRLFGTAAALIPITVITGCSEEPPPPPAPPQTPEPEPARPQSAMQQSEPAEPAPEPEPAAEPEPQQAMESDSGDMPRLSLDDSQAQALGYKHDAANVDPQKYPQRVEGNVCRNCALYQAGPDTEWGPCTLFPGKQVKATGWCSGYTPRPS